MSAASKEAPGTKAVRSKKDPVLFATNLKFLFAFVFLCFFAGWNYLILNNQINLAERSALVISFMEGQYSLVQKTTFLSIAYSQSMDLLERKNLRENVHDDLRSLLVFGTVSNDIIAEKTKLPREMVPMIRKLYFSSSSPLNQQIEEYFSSLKKFLLGSPIKVRPDNLQLVAFQTKSSRVMGLLRSTIKKFQKDALEEIVRLRNLGAVLFALNGLCLGLIGIFVFLPTLKRLGSYLGQLKNVNDALEIKVTERTGELEQRTHQLVLANEELRNQIDERVRMEKEIRQTNAFLDSIIENIPDMIFIKDAQELRFVRFNRAGERLLGYNREELLGKNDYSFFPKPEADFFVEKDRNTLTQGTILEILEEPIHTRKKGPRILHTKKIPVMDASGKPAYLLGISEDITERIHSDQQLRDLSMAMEHALDGIARLDANKKFLSVNKACATMTGYTPEEMIGLNRMSMICPEDADKATAAFEEMKKTGKSEAELKVIRKDGSIFHQYVVLIRSLDKEKHFDGFYCFSKDVTERKYKESLEAKAELIQMVSHELRTPIHSVKEGLSIVLEGLTGELTAEQKEVLNISKRCVDRLVRLVNDVLAFHKLESGVIEFDMKKENVNKLIEEVGAAMRPLVENKNLKLEIKVPKHLPEIPMDRDKIIQVLTNLLQNAIKFTLEGTITLAVALDPQGIMVSVEDTGIGIQSKDIPKLFRKFGQLESAKLVAPGGTGLGLAISKKIVERHHGKIHMESEYKKGSIFSFTLPLEQPKPSAH